MTVHISNRSCLWNAFKRDLSVKLSGYFLSTYFLCSISRDLFHVTGDLFHLKLTIFFNQIDDFSIKLATLFYTTRIFGAFGPIMFDLQVWVGFRASWRGEPLFLNSSFMFGRTHSSCLEGHMAACSEGHFLSIVFGRTHCIMFGRALFRI